MTKDFAKIEELLERIAAALERRGAPPPDGGQAALEGSDVFVWEAEAVQLVPVAQVAAVPLDLLKGIDAARDTLFENTRRFASGLPANNALLWGARGMGKSSLVKAVHAEVNKGAGLKGRLALIEIHREDIISLPLLLRRLRGQQRRFLLFCDDLSFDRDDTSYKSLGALRRRLRARLSAICSWCRPGRRRDRRKTAGTVFARRAGV